MNYSHLLLVCLIVAGIGIILGVKPGMQKTVARALEEQREFEDAAQLELDPGEIERKWRPPSELVGPPPRQARMTPVALRLNLVVLAGYLGVVGFLELTTGSRFSIWKPALLLAALFVWVFSKDRRARLLLLRQGQVAGALLTEVHRETRGKATCLVANYGFFTPDGTWRNGSCDLGFQNPARRGSIVTVLFLPSNPEKNIIYPVPELEVLTKG